MSGRPQKRSLTLKGHRTSVSLEDEFWGALKGIASAYDRPINDLVAEIDKSRGLDMGLASAIRIFILQYYQSEKRNN